MRLKKANLLLLIVLIATSAYSQRIAGTYSTKGAISKSDRQFAFEKHLQLNKDSTFSYLEWYKPQDDMMPDGILEKTAAIKFIGKGKYSLKQENIVLNFARKIRKVDSIAVTPLTTYDTVRLWEQINGANKRVEGKSYVFIIMDINGSFFGNGQPMAGGYVIVNNYTVYPELINYMACDENQFPLTLNFDFEHLSGQDESNVVRLLFPRNEKTLGRNLGYQDEVVTLPKPGNYKIEIRPTPGGNTIDSQVFTGTRSFPIKSVNGVMQIGELVKTKSK